MGRLRASRNVSFFIFLLSFLSFCIGFAVPFWYKGAALYEGIWQSCKDDDEGKSCVVNSGFGTTDPLIMGVQATMCIALASYIIALGFYCVWIKQAPNGLSCHGRTALIFSIFAGVSNCLGVLVYAMDFLGVPGVSFDWGFVVSMVSGGLTTLNGLFTACCVSREGVKNQQFST